MHTLRLKLEMNKNTAYIMEKRFRILAHISNQIRKHVKKLLSRLENDKQYQQALDEYIRLKKLESNDKQVVADMKRLSKFMNETRENIGLTKSGLHSLPKTPCINLKILYDIQKSAITMTLRKSPRKQLTQWKTRAMF